MEFNAICDFENIKCVRLKLEFSPIFRCKIVVRRYAEAKLKRVKGAGREPQAKDIIKGLSELRQCQLSSVSSPDPVSGGIRDSDLPYISDSEYIEDYDRSSVTYMLQRRIAPERQAVNPVELKVLIENDELAKTVVSDVEDIGDVLGSGDGAQDGQTKVDGGVVTEEPAR